MTPSENNDFIVAIELGSSKISGIAGRKKDGTWQILAYAEEKSAGCIRRGVVYNIEKTYQCINSIKNKLEQVLKTKIARAYVGIGGQSLRSHKCVVKRSMVTQSYITNEAIDSIQRESNDIPFTDYEVLENFPQEYKVDGVAAAEPVGVLGTNIEGEFLNVIANRKLKHNVESVLYNVGIEIVNEDNLIAPLQLAANVLNDAEKRSGCALIDLGADTTTLIIYKNNIVRYLVTIPLGSNNINKDLATLPIDETETESVKLRFGDACAQDSEPAPDAEKYYNTYDGRQVEVATIKRVIEARTTEIIHNVCAQLVNSSYNGNTLLSGLVLTGGGSNMKNIEAAFKKNTKIDKVRIAKKIEPMVVKTSNAASITLDNSQSNTIISLMMAGSMPCGGDSVDNSNLFDKQRQDEEAKAREMQQKQEQIDAAEFDKVKEAIRAAYTKVKATIEDLEKNGKDKKVRSNAHLVADSIVDEVVGEKYAAAAELLEGKDKYKNSLEEGDKLVAKLKEAVEDLQEAAEKADKDNSVLGKVRRTLQDLMDEK